MIRSYLLGLVLLALVIYIVVTSAKLGVTVPDYGPGGWGE